MWPETQSTQAGTALPITVKLCPPRGSTASLMDMGDLDVPGEGRRVGVGGPVRLGCEEEQRQRGNRQVPQPPQRIVGVPERRPAHEDPAGLEILKRVGVSGDRYAGRVPLRVPHREVDRAVATG